MCLKMIQVNSIMLSNVNIEVIMMILIIQLMKIKILKVDK